MASRTWRFVGLGLLIAILIISGFIIWEFLDVLIFALALAYIVYPLAKKLNRGRTEKSWKYLFASMLAVLIVALPVLFVIFFGLNYVLQWFGQTWPAVHSGAFFEGLEEGLTRQGLGMFSDRIVSELTNIIRTFSMSISNSVLNPEWITLMLVKIALFFVTAFYFVYEGPHFKAFLDKHIPKNERFIKELITSFNKICYGLFVGHLFTSVFIALFTFVGLWVIFQFNPWVLTLLTITMFVIAFLPVIGPWLMYFPMGVWYILVVDGGALQGIELIIFGLIFLTFIPDFYIRPKLITRSTEIHPLLIILGFFGGPLIFGVKGFIIGPLILGLAQAILTLYVEKRHILKELVEHF